MMFLVNSGTDKNPNLLIVCLDNLKIFYNPHTNLYDIKGFVKQDYLNDVYVKLYSYSSLDLCNKFIAYAVGCYEKSENYFIFVPSEEELRQFEFEISFEIDEKTIFDFYFGSSK